MATRFDPAGPAARVALRPPADKSISHRAALIAAMGEGETAIEGYLDAADTRSTLDAVGSARRAVVEAARGRRSPTGCAIAGVGLQGAVSAGDRRRQRRHPAAAAAGLARRAAGRDLGARRRRVDPPAAGRPDRRAARRDGRAARRPRGPLRAADDRGRAAARDLLRAAGRQRPGQVVPALRRPARRGRDAGRRAAADPRPQRAHARGRRRRDRARRRRGRSCGPRERLEVGRDRRPRPTSPRPPSSSSPRFSSPAARSGSTDVGLNPTRTGLLDDPRADGRGDRGRARRASRAASRPGRSSPARRSCAATEVGGAEVPLAIDELPLVALAACFAEGTTTIRDAAELRRKESDRIATVAEALNALGGRVEPTEDGMVVEGTGGLRGGRIDSHGDHRIAMLGAVAGLASREGVEVEGMDAAAVSYPGFEADLASLSAREGRRPRRHRHGEGPPIVFVPGTIVGAETTWRRQLPLAERWSLVIADRPGLRRQPAAGARRLRARGAALRRAARRRRPPRRPLLRRRDRPARRRRAAARRCSR